MRWLTLALLIPLTACYTYVPIADGLLEPGTQVRAHLTDSGTDGMAALIGPRVAAAHGTLLRKDDSELVLAVEEVVTLSGVHNPWARETVAFPNSAIGRMEGKQFSKSRTLVFTGGLLVASLIAKNLMQGGLFGGGDRDVPDPGSDGPGNGQVH